MNRKLTKINKSCPEWLSKWKDKIGNARSPMERKIKKEEGERPSVKLEEIEFIETPTDIVKKAIKKYEDDIMTAYKNTDEISPYAKKTKIRKTKRKR